MSREAFAAFVLSATYEQAERAYFSGRMSAEQWEAYQNLWALSAPRFSDFALAIRARVRASIASAQAAS